MRVSKTVSVGKIVDILEKNCLLCRSEYGNPSRLLWLFRFNVALSDLEFYRE